jgi:hypothetical protein
MIWSLPSVGAPSLFIGIERSGLEDFAGWGDFVDWFGDYNDSNRSWKPKPSAISRYCGKAGVLGYSARGLNPSCKLAFAGGRGLRVFFS